MSDSTVRLLVGVLLILGIILFAIWVFRELDAESAEAAIEAGRGWCRACRPAFGGGA